MPKYKLLQRVHEDGIIAIIRAERADHLVEISKALLAGGLGIIEVTMTTGGALDMVQACKEKLGTDCLFGVGSVLDPETARLAILAGADFLVTPTVSVETIRMANRYSVPIMMGAYTPTEAQTAWEHGADLIKVFPSETGGLKHLKAMRAPLPQIDFVPTGGISVDNVASYLQAGAFAVGVGSALVHATVVADGLDKLTQQAHRFREQVDAARKG
jgi:2-dehydro-3-deoxyphosphogluconate aldolase / (4S)-4-hydroxy-2-oxoglutarate aldolase